MTGDARPAADRRGDHQRGHRAGGDVRRAAVIPILFLAQIAFIVAFGVLLDTFIVRTLLVPALAIRHGLVHLVADPAETDQAPTRAGGREAARDRGRIGDGQYRLRCGPRSMTAGFRV